MPESSKHLPPQGKIISALTKYLNVRNLEIDCNDQSFLDRFEKYCLISYQHKNELYDIDSRSAIINEIKETIQAIDQDVESRRLIRNTINNQLSSSMRQDDPVLHKAISDLFPIDDPSSIINQGGICSGLSKLWAFTQRQQDRNNQSIDNDPYDFDKLNKVINDIVTWEKNGAKASEIEWNVQDDKTQLIKSQDLELLISSLNLMQSRISDLFPNTSFSQDLVEIRQKNIQGLALFQSVERSREKPDEEAGVKSPTMLLTDQFKIMSAQDLENNLKELLQPGLIFIISVRPNEGPGHDTSVYMSNDKKIKFYDPNEGADVEINHSNELAKKIIEQMQKTFLGKELKYEFRVWSLEEAKELAQQQDLFQKKYLKDALQKRYDSDLKKKGEDFLADKESVHFKAYNKLTKENILELGRAHPGSYKILADNPFPEYKINLSISPDMLKIAQISSDSHKILLESNESKEGIEKKIQLLVSDGALEIGQQSSDAHSKLTNFVVSKNFTEEKFKLLISDKAVKIAQISSQSYNSLVESNDSKEGIEKKIQLLLSDEALEIGQRSSDAHSEFTNFVVSKNFTEEKFTLLMSNKALEIAKKSIDSYSALLKSSSDKECTEEKIELLISEDAQKFASSFPDSYNNLVKASSYQECTKEKIELLISEDVRKLDENNDLYNYKKLLKLSENELSELVGKKTIKNPLHELDEIKQKLSEHIVKENPSSPKSKHSTSHAR